MASILKVDELRGIASTGDITITSEGGSATMQLQQGVTKQWANINGGSGTPVVRDSFNNSSLTDNGTGDYTLALSNSMDNANYSLQTTGSGITAGAPSVFNRKLTLNTASAAPTTSQYIIASGYNYYSASAFYDNVYNFIEVNGDLA